MDINECVFRKNTVQTFRNALMMHLLKEKKESHVPVITSNLIDLETYKGNWLPLYVFIKELNTIAIFLQDDFIGIKVAYYIKFDCLRLYKGINSCIHPLLNSNIDVPPIIIARLAVNYIQVMTNSIELELITEKDKIHLKIKPLTAEALDKNYLDCIVCIIYKCILAFSKTTPNKYTLFYRSMTDGLSTYQNYMNVSTELSSNSILLSYGPSRELKNKPYFIIDSATKQALKGNFSINHLHHMFRNDFPKLNYTAHTYHILYTIISILAPVREEVAKVLNISVSSLQRRLRLEGTSFKEVLLRVRKDLAHEYLVNQNIPATYVAVLLGYESSSQFFTVFKGWFSMTPNSYKNVYSSR